MKKLFFTIFLGLLLSGASSGQWINTMWLVPANPTFQDTIILYADLSFPSGSCDQHSKITTIFGNTVDAYAIHCLGALTFICGHIDTFHINPLPVGTYTYRLHVDQGGLPSPCTPGINPGPTDSISFTVSPVTGMEVRFPESGVMVFPTPAADKLYVRNDLSVTVNLEIYSITGTRVVLKKITGQKDEIDIHNLPMGYYYVKVIADGLRVETKRIAVMR